MREPCIHCGVWRGDPDTGVSQMFVYNWETDPNYGKAVCHLCLIRVLPTRQPLGVLLDSQETK